MARKNFRLTLEDENLQKWSTQLQAVFDTSDKGIKSVKSSKSMFGILEKRKNYTQIVLSLQAIIKEARNEIAKY